MPPSKGKKRKREYKGDYKFGGMKKRKQDETVKEKKMKSAMGKAISSGTTELKYSDAAISTTVVTPTGDIYYIVPCALGTKNKNERIGSSIFASKIHVKISTEINALDTFVAVRWIIFMDKQQVANTLPNVNQVLESVSYLSPINYTLKNRWQILHDKTYDLTIGGIGQVTDRINVLINKEINYVGDNANNIGRNGIYILIIGSEPTNRPFVDYYSRITYTDK